MDEKGGRGRRVLMRRGWERQVTVKWVRVRKVRRV